MPRLTPFELARRRQAWFANHNKTVIVNPALGQATGTNTGYTVEQQWAQAQQEGETLQQFQADNPGFTVPIGGGGPLQPLPGSDYSGYTYDNSGTSSGSSSGGLSTIGSFLQSIFGGSSHPVTYNGQQGAPPNMQPPPNSYNGVTTPPGTPPSSGFSLSELTDFSTPYPYLALGGIVLLIAAMRPRGGGGGSNFIKI